MADFNMDAFLDNPMVDFAQGLLDWFFNLTYDQMIALIIAMLLIALIAKIIKLVFFHGYARSIFK